MLCAFTLANLINLSAEISCNHTGETSSGNRGQKTWPSRNEPITRSRLRPDVQNQAAHLKQCREVWTSLEIVLLGLGEMLQNPEWETIVSLCDRAEAVLEDPCDMNVQCSERVSQGSTCNIG